MKKKYTCIVVGYGYMGVIRKRVVDGLDGIECLAVVEPSASVAAKVSGCPVYSDYEQALALEPDIVFVCTPNRYAPEICVKAMERGKHVFCEKPPGRDLADIQAILDAEKGGVKLMFGFNHRFHPGVTKAKAIIDSGRMGRILSMRGVYGKSGGRSYNENTSWRNDKAVSGGGILLDQGIHMLDLFRYFCGDFPLVKCFANNAYWNYSVEDNAAVILQNDAGQIAMLHSSATQWKHTFHMNILMEEGYLVIEGLLSKTGSYGREKLTVGRRQFEGEAEAVGNPTEEVTYFDRDMSWNIEVEEILKAVDADAPVTVSNSEDAFRVMEIIDKAYRDSNVQTLEVRK
ncbi:MAG: Gfo/Idh/MocA family oxidoreductase [Pseudodesulfovibrio sp.]